MTEVTKEVKATITAVTRATKAMQTAAANAVKSQQDLATMAETSSAIAEEIEYKASQLDQIESQVEAKVREAAADTAIRIKEHRAGVLNELLDESNLAEIRIDDLAKLRMELNTAKADNSEAINSAVNAAVEKAEAEAKMVATNEKSKYEVSVAELNGRISSLEFQNKQLQASLDNAQETIRDERTTRVEMAKAAGSPVINVPASSGR